MTLAGPDHLLAGKSILQRRTRRTRHPVIRGFSPCFVCFLSTRFFLAFYRVKIYRTLVTCTACIARVGRIFQKRGYGEGGGVGLFFYPVAFYKPLAGVYSGVHTSSTESRIAQYSHASHAGRPRGFARTFGSCPTPVRGGRAKVKFVAVSYRRCGLLGRACKTTQFQWSLLSMRIHDEFRDWK